MKRFIAEADRTQITLLPESLDDYIDEPTPSAPLMRSSLTLVWQTSGSTSFPRPRDALAIIHRSCSGSSSMATSTALLRAAVFNGKLVAILK